MKWLFTCEITAESDESDSALEHIAKVFIDAATNTPRVTVDGYTLTRDGEDVRL